MIQIFLIVLYLEVLKENALKHLLTINVSKSMCNSNFICLFLDNLSSRLKHDKSVAHLKILMFLYKIRFILFHEVNNHCSGL